MSSAGTSEICGWQSWELLGKQTSLPLALHNWSKSVWNEGVLLWVWQAWEKVPFAAARSGRWLDAPQDALVAGWSDMHWNDPLAFHNVFPCFLKGSLAFRIYFLKYRLNKSKTVFEGCVLLFLPLRNSGSGCIVEYPSAKQPSSALFHSPLPPKEGAKTAPKAALTGSCGSFCSVMLWLGRSLRRDRSGTVLSSTLKAQRWTA